MALLNTIGEPADHDRAIPVIGLVAPLQDREAMFTLVAAGQPELKRSLVQRFSSRV